MPPGARGDPVLGLPIIADGKLIGAVGVSGVLATQNAQIGRAGIEVLKSLADGGPPT